MIGALDDLLTPQGIAAIATLIGAITALVLQLRRGPPVAPPAEPSHLEPPHGTPPAAA